MAKLARAPRKKTKKKAPEQPHPTLERLKEIAGQVGLEVREERLTREVGHSVRGGLCRVDDLEVVLLDKNVEQAQRIETLAGVLSDRDLESLYIEPELRRLIGGRAVVTDDTDDADVVAAPPTPTVDTEPGAQPAPEGA